MGFVNSSGQETGSSEQIVGVTCANRDNHELDVSTLVGFLVSVLPIRVELAGEDFQKHVRAVKDALINLMSGMQSF